jgi:hypothetical protein
MCFILHQFPVLTRQEDDGVTMQLADQNFTYGSPNEDAAYAQPVFAKPLMS